MIRIDEGEVNFDAKTGDYIKVREDYFIVLDTTKDVVHMELLSNGKRDIYSYDDLRKNKAIYKMPYALVHLVLKLNQAEENFSRITNTSKISDALIIAKESILRIRRR